MTDGVSAGGIGAFAIARGEEAPTVFLAETPEVLDRVLALCLVAQMSAADVSSESRLSEMRQALLEERWGDAVAAWIDESDLPVDVYSYGPKVWTVDDLDLDHALLEIRVSPLFRD